MSAQDEDDQRLMFHLGEMYKSLVLGVGNPEITTRLTRNVVQADQRLFAAAQRMSAKLEPICAKRDSKTAYVEHKQLELLRKLMEAANG